MVALCINNHEMTAANTLLSKKNDGWTRKVCRECKNAQRRTGWIKAPERNTRMTVDKSAPARFGEALEEASRDPEKPQPQCATPVGEISPWIDWATEEEDREPYEGSRPSRQDALRLCEGCDLYNLCADAALAKPPYHGVRSAGLMYEGGRRLK